MWGIGAKYGCVDGGIVRLGVRREGWLACLVGWFVDMPRFHRDYDWMTNIDT